MHQTVAKLSISRISDFFS